MVIENRDAVVAGTKLKATYKKQEYVCSVEAGDDGKLAFVYDGKSYNSPSSAGTAVIGTACNGWRFWSVDGEAPAASQPTAKTATKRATTRTAAKAVRVFYRSPNQRGLDEGQTRYYCNACMAGFVVVDAAFGGMPVDACPNGHSNDDPELTGAPSSDVVAADKAEAAAE